MIMKTEDKELLLRDLCARLPYRVKLQLYNGELDNDVLNSIDVEEYIIINGKDDIEEVKPYLFPLSSMTGEQEEEYVKHYDIDLKNSAENLKDRLDGKGVINGYPMYNHIDWLNKNHFDYRGLIEKSLAIDATGLNIY